MQKTLKFSDCRKSIRKQIRPSCRRIFRVRFVFVWFRESSEIHAILGNFRTDQMVVEFTDIKITPQNDRRTKKKHRKANKGHQWMDKTGED